MQQNSARVEVHGWQSDTKQRIVAENGGKIALVINEGGRWCRMGLMIIECNSGWWQRRSMNKFLVCWKQCVFVTGLS